MDEQHRQFATGNLFERRSFSESPTVLEFAEAVFLNDRNVFLQNYKSLLFVGENGEFGPFRSNFFRYNDCFWVTIGRNARSFPSTSLLLIIIQRVFLNNRIRYGHIGIAGLGPSFGYRWLYRFSGGVYDRICSDPDPSGHHRGPSDSGDR